MGAALTQLGLGDDLASRRHALALARSIRGDVRFDLHNRLLWATDASIYQVEPLGVVLPADLNDLQQAVRYCTEHRLAMLPRGGGTSLAGQCVNRAVVLDLSRHLRGLVEVDLPARSCRVKAGTTLAELNAQLAPTGLFFAPDPSTVKQANVGGCIGNNAAGTRSIRYGRTSESLLGVDVLLADGARHRLDAGAADRDPHVREITQRVIAVVDRSADLIRERFPKTLRRNAGYALDMILAQLDQTRAAGRDPLEHLNLAPLICGSEGTLAIVHEAQLKLHPCPAALGLAAIGFATLDSAIKLVPELIELGPSAVELLDDLVIATARLNTQCRPYVERLPAPSRGELNACLYVEFSAEHDAGEFDEPFRRLRDLLQRRCPEAAVVCEREPGAINDLLALRQAGEPLLHAIPGSRKPLGFVEDNAVPVERLGEFVRGLRELFEAHGTRAAFYAHASVGVLHVRPLLDLRDADDERRMHDIARKAAELAKSLGGVMSGEHGDGRARGPLLHDYFGDELIDAFREIKDIFDPNNLLNPGNIVEPGAIESISETTRIKPEGRLLPRADVDTYFRYQAAGDFDHAVALCNGSGVCRKTTDGVMCPSYMATRDERHSTRGRGNALRAAISGQTRADDNGRAAPDWHDPATHETLDLCLSCKACKSECPTNVDIATYKAEYLAQGYRERGRVPLSVLAFGNVRPLNRMGSAFAPLSNIAARSWPGRFAARNLLGLARDRSIPAFAPSLMRQAKRGPINKGLPHDAPAVLLFADCFTAFNEPRIGLASIELLNAFGYRVHIADVGCCARTQLSAGLLGPGRRIVPRTAAKLSNAIRASAAQAALVCEPSCLSAIHDEWLDLDHPETAAARHVADHARLVEQFISERWGEHPHRPGFRAAEPGAIRLHGHCHQKALWGAESSAQALRLALGQQAVYEIESTCCGMAGSFGYTADRYDLSMRIGGLHLFPAVEEAGNATIIGAPGTSCRHQIYDGTGRSADHPATILRDHLS